jgi:putative endonuclease
MPFDFQNEALPGNDCALGTQFCFDFETPPVRPLIRTEPNCSEACAKGTRQRANYYAGLSAEETVARCYARDGAYVLETRWRGPGGEIDLILGEGDRVVFVEVKKSKTHAQALQRVTPRQMARILASAEAYLALCPKGTLTDVRVDVALVDARGVVDIVPNAGMAA